VGNESEKVGSLKESNKPVLINKKPPFKNPAFAKASADKTKQI
jgi:hypothetical protein